MSTPTPNASSSVPPQQPAAASQHSHHHNGGNKPGAGFVIALVASFTFVAVVFFGMGAISGAIAGKALSGGNGHHSQQYERQEPVDPRVDPNERQGEGKPGLQSDRPFGQSESDNGDEAKQPKQGPVDESSDGLLRAPDQGNNSEDSEETNRFGYRFQSN